MKGCGSPRGAPASANSQGHISNLGEFSSQTRSSQSLCLPFPPPMRGLSPVCPEQQGNSVIRPPSPSLRSAPRPLVMF